MQIFLPPDEQMLLYHVWRKRIKPHELLQIHFSLPGSFTSSYRHFQRESWWRVARRSFEPNYPALVTLLDLITPFIALSIRALSSCIAWTSKLRTDKPRPFLRLLCCLATNYFPYPIFSLYCYHDYIRIENHAWCTNCSGMVFWAMMSHQKSLNGL